MIIISQTKNGEFSWSRVNRDQMGQFKLSHPNDRFIMDITPLPREDREYARAYYFRGVVGSHRQFAEDEGTIMDEKEAHATIKFHLEVESTKGMDEAEYWRFVLRARRWVMKFWNIYISPPKSLSY